MNWERRSYMYGGVNLSRHAKSKGECQRQMCQGNTGYGRNTLYKETYFVSFIIVLINVLINRDLLY